MKKVIPGYSVSNHWLNLDGKLVNVKLSPNRGRLITPEIIVIHYTGDNSLQSALDWLCAREAEVSAHLVIAKTGAVWQLMPFNVQAWHAGRSEYDGRAGVNNFSIGIENVGTGDEWPDAQIQANIGIIRALYRAYGIEDTVGHEDVAVPPGRKVDPGPRYPWKTIFPNWEG